MNRTVTKPEPSATTAGGVELDAVYPHPPERVWRALTDPRALSRWLLPGDFAPRPGHRFIFRHGREGRIRGEVVAVEEDRRLSYTWRRDGEPPSLVTWTLEPVEGGQSTRVRLTHTSLNAGASASLWPRRLAALERLLAPALFAFTPRRTSSPVRSRL